MVTKEKGRYAGILKWPSHSLCESRTTGVLFKCHYTNASTWETEEELEIHEWWKAMVSVGLERCGWGAALDEH